MIYLPIPEPLPTLEFTHVLECSGRKVTCSVERAVGQAPNILLENIANLFAVEQREVERWLSDVAKALPKLVTEEETLAFEWREGCKLFGKDPSSPRPEVKDAKP